MHHALKTFEIEALKKLTAAVRGQPEDAIRSPAEALLRDLATTLGAGTITVVPETPDPNLAVRPDMAILRGALIGHVELKAPGKGADPRRFAKGHDRDQWEKLKALPNLIYFDGEEISLWRSGELAHGILRLGRLDKSGLTVPPGLDALLTDFLSWSPITPRTVGDLAQQTARLCRLLRDEAAEQLNAGSKPIIGLRNDWRAALAPGATDAEFADGYAQAVTFGLLMARARGIALHRTGDLRKDFQNVGHDLRVSDTLIGTALEFLGADPAPLRTSLGTLVRVLDAVDWPSISKGDPEAWLYFYEPFLKAYDPALHRLTGTYYTPAEVVSEMVRLADDALRDPALFDLVGGLAHPDVTLADPATGTGTFLLAVLRRIRDSVTADQGTGAVPGAIRAAAGRLIGFELQFGPFVVAQLRLLAELLELTSPAGAPAAALPAPRVYLTDTLSDPEAARTALPSLFAPITDSYAAANAVKAAEPITVVIGNPPYKEKAEGRGGWIEQGRYRKDINAQQAGPLADWAPATADSAHAKHLKNLYVYFWRWAAWKAWGEGAGQGSRRDRRGVVCFITVAGFLNGPGFKRMRAELRREADAIWIIDCTPEGHQPPVSSRIFQSVQQPVCIVMVARKGQDASGHDARVLFRRLPEGPRTDKFAALAKVELSDSGWAEVAGGGGDPFLPAAQGEWAGFAPLGEMFGWDGSGVMPGRTWVIAPDRQSLVDRWDALKAMTDPVQQAEAFFPHLRNGKPGDKHIDKTVKKPLAGQPSRPQPVRVDTGGSPKPLRYGMRSFDRQWILPDARLINQPNPTLWEWHSDKQVYLTALARTSPRSGPAVTFSALVPDLDHYKGSFGGRVFPLWSDAAATIPNAFTALLDHLAAILGRPVPPEDHFAWIAGVAAHPAFTARFAADLIRPGLRIPLTADPALWEEGVRLGRRVVWLHTYGDRFADPAEGRLRGAPRIPGGPIIPATGAIPGDPADFPDELRYDVVQQRLHVGKGHVDNVVPKVRAYEVSGKNILTQWFSYRKADRTRPLMGDKRPPSPLDRIRPDGWLADYTSDLVNLLHVLTGLVDLEPAQADLLDRVMASPLIEVEDVLKVSPKAGKLSPGKGGDQRQKEMEI
ncbi:type ISP restriction/modification enzyme [Paracoccus sediminis]|uniref:site-specific DNA-methyltransferase (adenine-specific) n=1 Tax=Paracoccus sediminis TaxID=1214787 RepID=A0A238YI32_9RHOB|nr:type ISP restriction/modification enzyme [Paracoccus sediminis]SNR70916.1 N-6 DNA Methylase [Paracoccus sediminis]